MITLDQATLIFKKMIADSGKEYRIDQVWEVELDEPIYVMSVIDKDGKRFLPGRLFPAINKLDGTLVPDEFPCPT